MPGANEGRLSPRGQPDQGSVGDQQGHRQGPPPQVLLERRGGLHVRAVDGLAAAGRRRLSEVGRGRPCRRGVASRSLFGRLQAADVPVAVRAPQWRWVMVSGTQKK